MEAGTGQLLTENASLSSGPQENSVRDRHQHRRCERGRQGRGASGARKTALPSQPHRFRGFDRRSHWRRGRVTQGFVSPTLSPPGRWRPPAGGNHLGRSGWRPRRRNPGLAALPARRPLSPLVNPLSTGAAPTVPVAQ